MFKETIETAKTIKEAWDKTKQLEDNLNHLRELNETSAKTLEIAKMTIELQQLVTSLQLDLRTLKFNHRDLEEKIRQYEKFEMEKDKYSPYQFSSGAVVYRPNQPVDNSDGNALNYYLCAHCYEQSKRSILQPAGITNGHHSMKCNNCSSIVLYKPVKSSYWSI
ncbi:hypothetical protein [Rodentibacter sp. Ppn85]|uniref:hypothetical protein n=1 Tax=Rodentibacter sp. Ppn85 TaxID=1908525 RepID=UPI00098794EE|nr:hypothetical protein [Rodentibacter sp. Ppn85]